MSSDEKKRGRKPRGEVALAGADRQRAYADRQRQQAARIESAAVDLLADALRRHPDLRQALQSDDNAKKTWLDRAVLRLAELAPAAPEPAASWRRPRRQPEVRPLSIPPVVKL